MIKLSNRLSTAAAFIAEGASVADIGTDHGYLPVFLAQTGKVRRILASDVNKGPLEHARDSARSYGVEDRIEFILANGLDGIGQDAADTVVLAGMGGETIISILEKAPWTLKSHIRLILQPQTKINELESWLKDNGYTILDAALACDEGRIYEVLYVGAGKQTAALEPLQMLLEKRERLLPEYIDRQLEKLQRALEGLEKSSNTNREELALKRKSLYELQRMREETKVW